SRGGTVIERGQRDENVAPVSQDPGVKSPMPFDIAGQRVFGHESETLREDADFVQHSCPTSDEKNPPLQSSLVSKGRALRQIHHAPALWRTISASPRYLSKLV